MAGNWGGRRPGSGRKPDIVRNLGAEAAREFLKTIDWQGDLRRIYNEANDWDKVRVIAKMVEAAKYTRWIHGQSKMVPMPEDLEEAKTKVVINFKDPVIQPETEPAKDSRLAALESALSAPNPEWNAMIRRGQGIPDWKSGPIPPPLKTNPVTISSKSEPVYPTARCMRHGDYEDRGSGCSVCMQEAQESDNYFFSGRFVATDIGV